MKRMAQASLVVAALLAAFGSPGPAIGEVVGTGLTGFEEVPVISTTGSGAFFARIPPGDSAIEFVLVYEDLEGGSVTQAHIHLAQAGVNGAIVIHFCGSGGKPACPAPPASIAGVLTSADVVAVPAQGIAAGDLGEVIRAIRVGKAYANVHTTNFPGGEVRGQIKHH
ncbi:MAG: CHRD domain-containing protein [Candidatus Rokuibacteriota bacterium]